MRKTLVLALLMAAPACNPYERYGEGEFYAGTVDPVDFPPAYLGQKGDPKTGGGTVTPHAAFAGATGRRVGIYTFAFGDTQAMAANPLDVGHAPPAYVFDPQATSPFPAMPRCTPPKGYVYDAHRDAYRFDEQGNIFTVLPDKKAGYMPVVSEIPVTSGNEPCQDIKSEETVLARKDVVVGMPSGRYLAWALVDPRAPVAGLDEMPDPNLGVLGITTQKWGWFNHFLVAYVDGGFIPTMAVPDTSATAMPGDMVTQAVTQKLYFPTSIPGTDPMTMMPAATMATGPGTGYDLVEAARGDAGYSPVCQVFSFTPADPMNPPTTIAAIDMATVMDTKTYVYCLQVQ